ncbi:MAG: prepilin-type N-terminal cleavage/methylation domain-containing protein [Cyanobacteria bacterium P01_D01_bin.6]
MANRQPASPGFTVIELLVVIIIIGVLAAIALPSYLSVRSRVASREAMLLLSSLMKEEQAHFVEYSEWSDNTGTLDTPNLSEYEVIVDQFNNHQTRDGENVSGVRLRAIPQKESLSYVMGKVWVADNDVQTVLCDSEKTTAFMQSKTYCPDG